MRQLFSRLLVVVLLVLACSGAVWGDNLTVTITKRNGAERTETGQESLQKALQGYGLYEVDSIEVSAGSFETDDWYWLKANVDNLNSLKKFVVTDEVESVADVPDTYYSQPFFAESLEELRVSMLKKVGENAFDRCYGLRIVSLPDATKIGMDAFNGCNSLVRISLPAATELGPGAFAYCPSLTSVSLPVATEIDYYAFRSCKNLESVLLPAARNIGKYAFDECEALRTVSLPMVTEIDTGAFYECTGLTSVSLPAATEIGSGAFNKCTGLESVSLPAATNIGSGAFEICKALTSVSLPVATNIGEGAFNFCRDLTSVSLPMATNIGREAFWECNRLTSLKLGATPPKVGYEAFFRCALPRTLIITNPAGIPLIWPELKAAAEIYDKIGGGAVDGVWEGWTIEKNPPTMLTVIVEPAGTGEVTIIRKDGGAVVKEVDKLTKGEVLVVATTPNRWCKYKKTTAVGAKDNGNNEWEVTAEPGEQVAFTVEFVKITPLGATIINPAEGGTVGISRKDGGAEVNEGDELTKGEVLIVEGKPNSGYRFKETKAVGAKDNGNNEWEVTAEPGQQVTFKVEFDVIGILGATSITPADCGTVRITHKKGGAEVNEGDVLTKGEVLVVTTKPNSGCKYKKTTAVGAKDNGNNEWKVTAYPGEQVVFTVEFVKTITLGASTITPADCGTVRITHKKGGAEVNEGDELTKGEVLIVEGKPNSGYSFKETKAIGAKDNGKDEWEVTANLGEQVVFTVEFEKSITLGTTTIEPVEGGIVDIVHQENGTFVNQGEVLKKGELLYVATRPNDGYKFKKATAEGATNRDNKTLEVTAKPGEKVNITVIFEKTQNGEEGNNNNNSDPTPVESVLLAQVQLSPNPTSGHVTVDAGTTIARCEVYSSTGALLQAIEAPESVFTIDLTASPSGVYLVRLVDMQGDSKALRVVKQ